MISRWLLAAGVVLATLLSSNPVFAKKELKVASADTFLQTTELTCVSNGIESVAGFAPSAKWLAAIAAVAQQELDVNWLSSKTNDPELARRNFHRRIAETVQAYGACSAFKINGAGKLTDKRGYGNFEGVEAEDLSLVMKMITGSKKTSDTEKTKVARILGFKDYAAMKTIFLPEVDGKSWKDLSSSERRTHFDVAGKGINSVNSGRFGSDAKGESLVECFSQIMVVQARMKAFQPTDVPASKNVALCKGIAEECGLTGTKFCLPPSLRGREIQTQASDSMEEGSLFDADTGSAGNQ